MIGDQVSDAPIHLNLSFNESVVSISSFLKLCGSPLIELGDNQLDHQTDMLNTEWAEVEIIELYNDQCGLGFSLMGSKSTGVVIRSIFPGSTSDKSGHLRIGDHLMYIDDVNVRGMTSEQVASILRQCTGPIRLIIARPINNYSGPEYCGSLSVVPTDQIDQHLDFLVHTLLPVNDLKTMELYQQISVSQGNEEAANVLKEQNLLQLVNTHSPPNIIHSGVNTQYAPDIPLSRVAGNPDQDPFEKSEKMKDFSDHYDVRIAEESNQSKQNFKESECRTSLPFIFQETKLIGNSDFENQPEDPNSRINDLHPSRLATSASTISSPNSSKIRTKHKIKINEENEFYSYDSELTKGEHGLGLTIAGYITCRPEVNIHGIFVKSVTKDSAADLNGHIIVNDQIIEINEQSVIGLDNPTVVEILKNATGTVKLKFNRYTKGPICEILTQTAKSSRTISSQSSSNSQLLNKSNLSINNSMKTAKDYLYVKPPVILTVSNDDSPMESGPENIGFTSLPPPAQLDSSSSEDDVNKSDFDFVITDHQMLENLCKTDELIANILPNSGFNVQRMNLKHATIDKTIEDTIKSTWNKIIGNNYDILISYINKVNEGLGISLEGTVDVDDVTGQEDKPHHYLQTIIPDGPIGRDGSFKPGDELLEANGKKLYGVPYTEVLFSLKSLPNRVQIVVARRKEVDVSQLSRSSSTMLYDDFYDYYDEDYEEYDENDDNISIDVDYNQIGNVYNNNWGFGNGSFLCGNDTTSKYQTEIEIKNIFGDNYRFSVLTKAKSDHSIFVSSTSFLDFQPLKTLTRNRSLQYLRDVAMWSGPILVELDKQSQGLGFSIDYYQDASSDVPVIVISSLVPNGVAHLDGRIIPGDRLLFINEVEVDSLSSKSEVIDILQSLPQGKVLLGFAKPMFPSGYMYRSYSKETVEELSTSQSLEYEPFTLADDPTLNNTYNSLQRAINDDVKLYQLSTCLVQQALHNAAIYLRNNNNIIVLLSCSSEISRKEINSQNSSREDFIDGESTVMHNTSSTQTTPKRDMSPVSNKSDPHLNLINYKPLHSPDFNLAKDLNESFSTIKSDGESFNKLKVHSDFTSSNTASSDINTSSSIDCLDDLEVTKISESDTDAMIHYWKNSRLSETVDISKNNEVDIDSLKKWFIMDSMEKNFELDTTKWCGIGYPMLNTPYARRNAPTIHCSPGDIITDINGHKLSEVRPDVIRILLSSLEKSDDKIKIGYISSDQVITSQNWLPIVNESKTVIPITQRVYKCSTSEDNNTVKINGEELSALESVEKTIPLKDNININGWTSPRKVIVHREVNQNLGISILGGKVANVNENDEHIEDCNLVSGIFITHIMPDSPASESEQLNIGDRLLSVNGKDLITASYDDAITYIRTASSPITFTIQSLIDISMLNKSDIIRTSKHSKTIENEVHEQEPISVYKVNLKSSPQKLVTPSNSPEMISKTTILNQVLEEKANSFSVSSLSNESFTADISELEVSKQEHRHSIMKEEEVKEIIINRQGNKGLGLLLVGNKDCSSMNCYICGFKENSVAFKDGRLMVGDELMKINGIDVHGMSHSNVAPIIKKCQNDTETICLTIRRSEDNINKMACIPTQNVDPKIVLEKIEMEKEDISPEETSPTKESLTGYGTILNVHLQKSSQGFGFFIMDGNCNDEPGIFVKKVTVDGIAANEGSLKEGDRILFINNEIVVNDDYDSVLRKLRGCKDALDLVVGRMPLDSDIINVNSNDPEPLSSDRKGSVDFDMIINPPPLQNQTVISPILNINEERKMSTVRASISHDHEPIYSSIAPNRKKSSITQPQITIPIKKVSVSEDKSPEPNQQRSLTQKEHPTKAQIIPGIETVIELTKDRGLGLSIVGGSDTILGTVMIHEVHEKEAAAVDGRLWAGDRVLAVNGKDLRNATHDQAIQALRSVGNRVRLKIFRDKQPLCEDSLYFKLKVDLNKKSRKGLGITIVSKTDVGVCISDLVKGSIADQDNRLKKGDLILEINETNVRAYTQDQVAALLKRCSGNVSLMVGRLRSKINSSQIADTSEKESKKKK